MEKSLIFYLSIVLFCCLLTTSCQQQKVGYKKEFSEEEKLKQAENLLSGMGYRYYYQGSLGEISLLEEAQKLDPTHPEVWREKGIPFLKRGIASGFYEPYRKCIEYDSLNWIGYRGYCYLYFYRDYERALSDFDALDILTPDFVDHPQAQSVDFMRSICYMGMGETEKALEYINQHVESEKKQVGVDYIDALSFVLKGLAHQKLGQVAEAQATFELGIKVHEKNADLEYHLAQLLHQKGEETAALKMLEKAEASFSSRYFNSRNYVEEFFQVYRADIEDLKKEWQEKRKI